MKKLKFLFCTIIFASLISMVNAQTSGSWIVPSTSWANQVVFDIGGPSINQLIPAPNGWESSDDRLFSAGAFDDAEDLQFYAVDKLLFDHGTNNSIGNFIIDNPYTVDKLSPEIEIIKVPGNEDNSYFVFYTRWDNLSQVDQAFCYTEVAYDEYSYTFSNNDKHYYDLNGYGYGAFAIGEDREENEEIVRDIYYSSSSYGLRKGIISASGVSTGNPLLVNCNDIEYGEDCNNFAAYNMELIKISDGEVLIAWIVRGDQGNEILFMYNDDTGQKYYFDDIGHGRINGIEFSQVDDELIYLSCYPSGNSGIYAYDIYSGTSQFLAGSENYGQTYLQVAKDGHIYAVSNDGLNLGRINMSTGNFEGEVLTIEVTTYTTNSGNNYYILPENSNSIFYFDLDVNADNLQCVGDCNADAEATPSSGDISDYTWEWTDGQNVISTTNTVNNLCEGEYTVCATHITSGNTVCETVNIVLDPALWDYTNLFEYTSTSTPQSPWNNENLSFARGLTVKAGETLELTNNTSLMFGEDAKLIVERGATLIVDNSILTNNDACPVFWEGVELWGIASANQSSTEHGIVEVINNGTIENSIVGIRTIKIEDDGTDGDPNFNFTGGIVYATNANFINNKIAVKFYSYS
ncbi:MAG: hypothetical protein K8R86_10755, partial [Bacteroidales bacterium]|nr:hypothetical protein [Bacteroidales bacterium]